MKIDFTKDWCVRMAQMEMDAGTDMEIGATCEATARAFDARETGRAYARAESPAGPKASGAVATKPAEAGGTRITGQA